MKELEKKADKNFIRIPLIFIFLPLSPFLIPFVEVPEKGHSLKCTEMPSWKIIPSGPSGIRNIDISNGICATQVKFEDHQQL